MLPAQHRMLPPRLSPSLSLYGYSHMERGGGGGGVPFATLPGIPARSRRPNACATWGNSIRGRVSEERWKETATFHSISSRNTGEEHPNIPTTRELEFSWVKCPSLKDGGQSGSR